MLLRMATVIVLVADLGDFDTSSDLKEGNEDMLPTQDRQNCGLDHNHLMLLDHPYSTDSWCTARYYSNICMRGIQLQCALAAAAGGM